MNHDDFLYGYEMGISEQQVPTRTYYKQGHAAGNAIGKGIGALIGGLFDLVLQVLILFVKGILLLVPVLFQLVKKAIPKRN